MLIDAKETPRAVLFNKTIVDKLAKADRKQSQDDGTVTYGNLPVSDNLFSPLECLYSLTFFLISFSTFTTFFSFAAK